MKYMVSQTVTFYKVVEAENKKQAEEDYTQSGADHKYGRMVIKKVK